MIPPVRLATRSSAQALAQSTVVADALRAAGHEVELVPVDTTGDRRADDPLHTMGGQGVFVKEVQRAVIDGYADLAVHSAKDLPSAPTPGLVIAAFCRRRSADDALIGASLADLPAGALVASGSVRRRAQLASVRPDLEFGELRGNIASRLDKIPAGGAIVMAVAALEILEMTDRIAERLDPEIFVPAVGQGCVAVECRVDDDHVRAALAVVDHAETRHAVMVERAFLAELGSGCSLPVGAHCREGRLLSFLADPARGRIERDRVELDGTAADLELARQTARRARAALAAMGD